MEPIILASQSPRRKQLLEWAAIRFTVLSSHSDESFPPGMPIYEVPEYIARNKAIAVRQQLPDDRLVLAADTIVVLDQEVIGKPRDRQDALEILTRLSGQKHEVITGVCMIRGRKERVFHDVTEVWFHPLEQSQLEWYVDNYKPYDKAGAYAIQEWIGVAGIKKINGDFYNVMGLPVSRVLIELQNWDKA